jgi:hypothetical protein
MNFCETCEYRNAEGICGSNKIMEDLAANYEAIESQDMMIYPYQEGGKFWVGPKFGCVHHASS